MRNLSRVFNDFFPLAGLNAKLANCLLALLMVMSGCSKPTDSEIAPSEPRLAEAGLAELAPNVKDPSAPVPSALDFDSLLESRLSQDVASEGWIQLFDGQSLFGWETKGNANFRVEGGVLVVDQGEPCLLCSTMPWGNYELVVEFKASEKTNSGVFLHTGFDPKDVETECYEVNIAADDHPFPTGGIVKRKGVSERDEQKHGVWRTMQINLVAGQLRVEVDGKLACDYKDPSPLPSGKIGLQYNEGRIEFRKVMLRPIGLESLIDDDLTAWKQYPEMDARFSLNGDSELHVQGGSGQLETVNQYGDFLLLAQYKLPTPEMNSGIFFRCIPGDKMMGYECQVSNESQEGNPWLPADCGTGGIFRRQDARVIAGESGEWATVVLNVHGESMAAWVNGIQVSDWKDQREEDENPRRGRRVKPGTVIIQGHDPETDALFRQFKMLEF